MPTQINNKLLSWALDIEPQALGQAVNTSRLPFIEGHVALMPDAHWGMGATVGSVIPTNGAVIPAAVGVDIGCGMIAARLPLTSQSLGDDLSDLHRRIARAVPAGVGQGHDTGAALMLPAHTRAWEKYDGLAATAAKQMGSLGSGNHFIEVCLDETDTVWVVLHSGSRGVGNKLAMVHIEIAKGLMREFFIKLDDPDLAYLVEGSEPFEEYISDMLWAQDYAMRNREVMLAAVLKEFNVFMGARRDDIRPIDRINCHHNFTQRERHRGKDLWITRKGAIKADLGDRGVIPGSMGTRSYIVSGLGNTAAYCSCSHGAGRRMSRSEAKRTLDPATLTTAMEGITWNGDVAALLDEHPAAYKDIDVVMENQKDLVTIDHTLHQILNYKGT
jgi:tRNA-splicing ligase RtcB